MEALEKQILGIKKEDKRLIFIYSIESNNKEIISKIFNRDEIEFFAEENEILFSHNNENIDINHINKLK